jgi:serine/threonine protein kinase/formylglycine-generating enzyme required for sulfatase activity/dienelactone hydrolase
MDESALVGQTVSHYRIVERLGGGGMGVVYKAVDLRLNRFVALKFLSASLTRDPEAKERFVHEAQAASALDHPNICTIHEIDETSDRELFLTMAYYEGETLKHRIERGPLSVDEAIDIATQVAHALARAHESGIVHRDIKPANLMLPKDGPVKIVDFGLAKLVGHSELTKTGTTVGTVAYMAPEQIRGAEAGPAADVWAVGVVLYQMLAGKRPFEGKDDLAVVSSILDETPPPIGTLRPGLVDQLQRIVARALDKNVANRYASATELLEDLKACRTAMAPGRIAPATIGQFLRRPLVAVAIVAILVAVTVPATLAYRRASRSRWARNDGIPEIMQLVAKDDYPSAFAVATEVERFLPNDPVLSSLWPQFSAVGTLITIPAGADVSVQPYGDTTDTWKPLGRTPIDRVRLPRAAFRFRIEKAGFEPQLLASRNPGALLGNGNPTGTLRPDTAIRVTMRPRGDAPDMVWVAGGAFPVGLTGFNSDQQVAVDAFRIDRHEVTNRDFKRFVDGGGYAKRNYWRELPSLDALAPFKDSTGRSGPATWELGGYASGQADYPVGGVSWYEAVAYCRSAGKELPTIFHWARAALSPIEIGTPLAPAIIPLSNFSGKSLAPVGAYRGLGPYGTSDMAGNAREWVWNEAANGRRWIPGGAWNDPDYMFTVPNSLPPLDRSATNGFRCAVYASDGKAPDTLRARFETYSRDHRSAKAVSNDVFDVFKRQYAYVKSPLNDRVESRDTSGNEWVREKITFDAGYEPGRVAAYLFLPKNAVPPYQLVVYFPGVGPFTGRTSSGGIQLGQSDYIVKGGRAFAYPVYKGSFERWDPFISLQGEEYLRTFRTRMGQWRQDLARVLDVLTARSDIDKERIAYYGASFGASTAFPLIALEDRLKVAVLGPAGFTYRELPPEADALNYLSRVTIPVLMMGGNHDYIFPPETAQKPMFDRLGTAPEQKRHIIFDSGHGNFPRSEMIREVLAWLDRYLGPVTSSHP